MVFFDQTVQVTTTAERLVTEIAASVRPNEQLITVKPNLLLIALRADLGYIYLLKSHPDDTVSLRLLVDTAANVRGAFRGKTPKEALTELLQAAPATDRSISESARQHLASLKKSSEGAPATASDPDDDIRFEDFVPNSAVSGSPRKPLPSTDNTGPAPWNPGQLTSYTFFLTTIGAGIAFGLNWRRLGKPEWMWMTILTAILVPLAIIVALVIGLKFSASSEVILGLVLLLAGANWGFIYTLWYLQRGAYKKWEETGDLRTLDQYRYNFASAIGVGVLITVGFVAFIGLYAYFSGRPNTYQGTELKITYPSSWAVQDKTQLEQCRDESYGCLLVVADSRFGSTAIIVAQFEAPGMTASDIARFSRRELSNRGVSDIAANESIQIDGLEAARFYYSAQVSDDLHYGMELYIVKDNWAYEITVESTNEGIFREKRKDIDAFLEGIDFL